jgi:hypothetical protein
MIDKMSDCGKANLPAVHHKEDMPIDKENTINPSYTSPEGGVYFPMSSHIFFIFLCLPKKF